MSNKLIFLTFFATVLAVIFMKVYLLLTVQYSLPNLENLYWGPQQLKELDSNEETITNFTINVKNELLNNLKLRLNLTRPLTPSYEDTVHEFGLNSELIKKILKYLKEDYNILERIKYLNKYPQFTTKIDGLNIHFVHIKSTQNKKLPLLMLHGWPSSVREFYGLIPTLSQQLKGGFTLDLVIPSLIGHGYSDGSSNSNFRSLYAANIYKKLMLRLGYDQFYVHGGDWGAVVASDLAAAFPENVLGFHSNFCVNFRYITFLKLIVGSLWPSLWVPEKYVNKIYPLHKYLHFLLKESGYFHLQATKPDTIGFVLDNSLEGMLIYMLEKMSVGTTAAAIYLPEASLDKFGSYEPLLDTLLFYYWFPQKGVTSSRIYAENFAIQGLFSEIMHTQVDEKVPCGCVYFENEYLYMPPGLLKDKFPHLIHYTTYPDGGHYVGLELPNILATDIISFIEKTIETK